MPGRSAARPKPQPPPVVDWNVFQIRPAFVSAGVVVSFLLTTFASTSTTAAHEPEQSSLPHSLVVKAGHVSASIATAPFGHSFRDGNGATVLTSVEGGGAPT